MNESADSSRFLTSYSARHKSFLQRWRANPEPVLGTLGPPGTSSHAAALYLQEGLTAIGVLSIAALRLYDRFDELRTNLCAGEVDYALVPSAYRDATAFHWNPDIRLAFHFAQVTPSYGIAVHRVLPEEGEVTVATMHEVRTVFESLRPPELGERDVRWIDTRSTHHAAEVTANGEAHLALTNDTSRETFGLRWLASRPGAEVVWLVFHTDYLENSEHTGSFLSSGGDSR